MDSSEAVLDIIEAHGSADDQREQGCFPMNQINKGERSLSSRAFLESGGDCTPLPNDVPEYLTNLILSDLYNLPGESVPMTPEIFGAMRGGNVEFMEKMKSYGTPMPYFKKDKGDSILHLAAAWGHLELVKAIVSECPYLLLEPNSKDQLPLHVAAHAGHLTVVEALVATITFFSAKLSVEEERERLNIYVIKDINGDTPLHLALKDLHKNAKFISYQKQTRPVQSSFHHFKASSSLDTSTRQREIAACLVKVNQRASFLANKDGVSPLYMATESSSFSLVNAMLELRGNNIQGGTSNLASRLEGRKSLVHVALKANLYVLDAILNEDPGLINERDEEGRTCLSVGASGGYFKEVCKLLDISTSNVYACDSDGSFPIHMAIEKGHMDIAKELLKRCPDSEYLLNKQGQNILHIAAKSGKAKSFLLDYVKRNDTKNHLIEEKDVDGNTPLHLATIHWRPRTLRKLTVFALSNPKVMDIKNKDGLRPIDIAELNLHSNYIFRERMTLLVLLRIYAPDYSNLMPLSGMTLRSRSEQHRSGDCNKYKDQINILLLVAALVATVTFAAGFTMPGGFNSSAPNPGMAILAKDKQVSDFLLLDSIALQCSIVTIVALIWAQLGDPDIVDKALPLALVTLYFALTSMYTAFVHGVQATIKQNQFLLRWITTTSIIFYLVIIFIFIPYILPQCYASAFLPLLLLVVNEDDAEKHHTTASGDSSVASSSNAVKMAGKDHVEKPEPFQKYI